MLPDRGLLLHAEGVVGTQGGGGFGCSALADQVGPLHLENEKP